MSLPALRAREGRAVVLLVTIGVAVLVTAAAVHRVTVRTFSLQVPNQFPLVVLSLRHAACEGPVRSPRRFDAISIWGAATDRSTRLRLVVRESATGRPLGSGTAFARTAETEQRVRLARGVPAGVPVRVCIQVVEGSFSLAGAPASAPGVTMTGGPPAHQFSLLLLDAGHQSLLSSLGTVFSRVALFRPSWVGPWTYWTLLAGILLAAGAAVSALVRAAADDAERPEHSAGPPTRES